MSVSPAPIQQQVLDENGLPTLPWTLFFNQNFEGDAGEEWQPSFTGLTISGTPAITGRFYRLSQYLVFFRIDIDPDTSTSATAGTTYVDNFPLDINSNGFCTVVSDTAGGGIGIVNTALNRIYVPAWTGITTLTTVLGICEAR
jgi:hypothetical protein